ncbi:uncharacterized protein METZ01_LOCUS7607, partial [marine metagenome]
VDEMGNGKYIYLANIIDLYYANMSGSFPYLKSLNHNSFNCNHRIFFHNLPLHIKQFVDSFFSLSVQNTNILQ